MATPDFSTTLSVDATPDKVFNAITNVRGWWSEEIEGETAKQNDVFLYHYQDMHMSKIRLAEVIPNKKIVWDVVNNYFKFTKDKSEWTGTKIIFDIVGRSGKTHLQFTHEGLVPTEECYKVCEDAWTNYIQHSLHDLIVKGKGDPNPKEGGFNEKIIKKWKLES